MSWKFVFQFSLAVFSFGQNFYKAAGLKYPISKEHPALLYSNHTNSAIVLNIEPAQVLSLSKSTFHYWFGLS